jgi:acyl-homoserine lactone acylase PvdQ
MRLGMSMVDGKKQMISFWKDESRFFSLVDNYRFNHFYQKLVLMTSNGDITARYNEVCKGHFNDDYTGPDHCAHNIARALFSTMLHLNKTVGEDQKEWIWRNVHVNEYPHAPFSMTPLKPFFHREVPIGGNGQTLGVSKYDMGKIK